MVKKIIKSESGVVGIVTAVLLIGLIVAVVSLVQAVYVPKWMEEKESEHMDQVVTQFAQLKSAIDTHVANEPKIIPIASPITLGSKELPYLMSLRAYGSLEILKDSYSHYNIEIINNQLITQLNESFGTIKYSSMNGYFIDQSFIYENGAFITSQKEGNMASMKPSILINTTEDTYINFTMVNITPIGGKSNGGGFGTTSILTQYNTTNDGKDTKTEITIKDVKYINISTYYYNAWNLSMNSTLKNKIDDKFSINSGENWVNITFTPPVTLIYKIVEIYAQIGPGWIE